MKSKHLEKALMQFAEEGAAKVFKPMIGSGFIVGVVGALQFEVLSSRIELEYGLPIHLESSQFTSARWVSGTKANVDDLVIKNKQHIATDNDGDTVFLTRLQWDIDRIARDYPKYQSVIPSKTSYSMIVDKDAFHSAVKRIKIMSHEKSNGVKVRLKSDGLTVSANHPSFGEANEDVPIQYNGSEIEIGFNARYLLDTLNTFNEGDIHLEINNELSPIILKSKNSPNYLGIIMPLKL